MHNPQRPSYQTDNPQQQQPRPFYPYHTDTQPLQQQPRPHQHFPVDPRRPLNRLYAQSTPDSLVGDGTFTRKSHREIRAASNGSEIPSQNQNPTKRRRQINHS
eukprot:GHVP01023056.1.p1 GENE.GHVP01023056.1~~GHVP01023056.1.p1  ORF type:complete len:118 (+),score=9.87 GHVP01023056.1:46-354(+)